MPRYSVACAGFYEALETEKPSKSMKLRVSGWSHLDSNQGPNDYESSTLTN